jgi:hypothetical protein
LPPSEAALLFQLAGLDFKVKITIETFSHNVILIQSDLIKMKVLADYPQAPRERHRQVLIPPGPSQCELFRLAHGK